METTLTAEENDLLDKAIEIAKVSGKGRNLYSHVDLDSDEKDKIVYCAIGCLMSAELNKERLNSLDRTRCGLTSSIADKFYLSRPEFPSITVYNDTLEGEFCALKTLLKIKEHFKKLFKGKQNEN